MEGTRAAGGRLCLRGRSGQDGDPYAADRVRGRAASRRLCRLCLAGGRQEDVGKNPLGVLSRSRALQNPAAAIANLGILGHPQIWTAPQTFQGGGTSVDLLTVGRGSGSVAGNVVLGNDALAANLAGVYNTAIGNGALEFVRGIGMRDPETHNGSYNTAVGSVVLKDNIEGIDNTGVGNIAL